MSNPYNHGLDQNQANCQPLTPLTFLARAASVFPQHTAVIHGGLRVNYAQFYSRSRQLASQLANKLFKAVDSQTAQGFSSGPWFFIWPMAVYLAQGCLSSSRLFV